jgi:hypothetical protein
VANPRPGHRRGSELNSTVPFVAARRAGLRGGAGLRRRLLRSALLGGLPPVEGVVVETPVITGSDGNDIQLPEVYAATIRDIKGFADSLG